MDFFGKAKGLLTGLGQPQTPVEKVPPKKAGTSYHAVAIDPGHHCCSVARALTSRRFLSHSAPPLPLKGCTQDDCTCRYVHFDDRRVGPRRARDVGICVDGYVETDRRGEPFRGRRDIDSVTKRTGSKARPVAQSGSKTDGKTGGKS